jgi:hypothetical protein
MSSPSSTPNLINNYFSEQTVTSWADLEQKLANFDSSWAFREQGDAEWKLQTSIERIWIHSDRDVAEQTAIALYKRRATGLRVRPPCPTAH